MNRLEKDQSNIAKPLAILFAGLFMLASAGAIYFVIQNNQMQRLAEMQKTDYENLDAVKQDLEGELHEIESSFTDKITENEELSATLQERVKEVEKLQWRLTDARSKLAVSTKENEEIKTRLTQLESIKKDLESDIDALAKTNNELRLANAEIKVELEQTNEYTERLSAHISKMSRENDKLIKRLYQIAPAGFIADNFIVSAEKRNDKLTSRAKFADEVRVQFDINNVPEEFRTNEELYLVVTQFDGRPLENIPTQTVKVAAQDPMVVKAADVEKIKLNSRQHVEMSFQADKDLEAGLYNVLVYADHGFLGATSFQLR